MKAILKQYGFIIYLVVAVLHLAAIVTGIEELRFITKLLLMPALALAVYAGSPQGKERVLLLTAILFSFAGDSFLLLDHKNPLFFIFGLVSFLITHILYIIYFIGIKPVRTSVLSKQPWIILPVIAYGFGLVYFLFPTLGDLKIPVIVYAIIICTMLLCSIHILKRVNKPAGWLFVGGALFFVLSDSLLAIAKFKTAFSYAPFLIMLTYCAAQYFIARGFVQDKAGI
jgi:uncharacterized membrane protein YhhN